MRAHLIFALVTLAGAVAVANPDRVGHSLFAGAACLGSFLMCMECHRRRDIYAAKETRSPKDAHFFHFIGLAFGLMFLAYLAVMLTGLFYGLPKV